MTNYEHVEKHYTGVMQCDKCLRKSFTDITFYKETEFWTCPICKTEHEIKHY